MLKNDRSIIMFFRELFREILYSSLGESAGGAVLLFMRINLGRDPYEVIWEDPKTFYHAMERILGAGAKVIINLMVMNINAKYGLNINAEHFIDLMHSSDQRSVEEMRLILKRIADCVGGRMKNEWH
ncbi:hypothetical protein KEJ29_02155 [Candidatus Bathyarchaeota archaeon]|nr:hypothetical protein [Candidatus Bathyarchaeota archaeon]